MFDPAILKGVQILAYRGEDDGVLVIEVDTSKAEDPAENGGDSYPRLRVWVNDGIVYDMAERKEASP